MTEDYVTDHPFTAGFPDGEKCSECGLHWTHHSPPPDEDEEIGYHGVR
jgi:hypothetical protein